MLSILQGAVNTFRANPLTEGRFGQARLSEIKRCCKGNEFKTNRGGYNQPPSSFPGYIYLHSADEWLRLDQVERSGTTAGAITTVRNARSHRNQPQR